MATISPSLLTALKLLAEEKGNRTRLSARLTGQLGAEEARRLLGELEERGVFETASTTVRLSKSLQQKGDRLLRDKLRARGLGDDEIADAFAGIAPENERAREVARKKWPSIRGDTDRDKAAKLVRFLAGRGFSQGVCWDAARALVSPDEDD